MNKNTSKIWLPYSKITYLPKDFQKGGIWKKLQVYKLKIKYESL